MWLNQVFHDCRNDAGLLSTQYGILVNNVFDTQVSLSIFLTFIHRIDSFNSMSNLIFEKAIQFKNLNTFSIWIESKTIHFKNFPSINIAIQGENREKAAKKNISTSTRVLQHLFSDRNIQHPYAKNPKPWECPDY